MLAEITGTRAIDTGEKRPDGTGIHAISEWPKPGQRITLPRQEALDLIHNELAYPASLKRRPKDRTEALVAAGIGA